VPPALMLPTEDTATEGCTPYASDAAGCRSPSKEQPAGQEGGQPADAVALLPCFGSNCISGATITHRWQHAGRARLAPAGSSPAAAAAGRSQAIHQQQQSCQGSALPRAMQHQARLLISSSQANSLLTAAASGLRSVKEGSGA